MRNIARRRANTQNERRKDKYQKTYGKDEEIIIKGSGRPPFSVDEDKNDSSGRAIQLCLEN